MLQIIVEAIQSQTTLRFLYKGKVREVEPQTYGCMGSGNDGLCAWQLSGGSGEDYRLYLTAHLYSLELGRSFNGPRPGYTRADRRFTAVYAEL